MKSSLLYLIKRLRSLLKPGFLVCSLACTSVLFLLYGCYPEKKSYEHEYTYHFDETVVTLRYMAYDVEAYTIVNNDTTNIDIDIVVGKATTTTLVEVDGPIIVEASGEIPNSSIQILLDGNNVGTLDTIPQTILVETDELDPHYGHHLSLRTNKKTETHLFYIYTD